ncbi:hypothetical protein [uncultured Campylobacter sp.]|uniref:hypothetical protein n=1 Tax=uncultured Campylobacter sp. TaxID=218934 RepID=UPI0028E8F446|nr:hypothetical protein [uncultured Campylobacter sp.]
MNESPGKENKESELLYRLDRRNPLMVMFDFIRFSFFLLVPALPTAIYYRGWMQALGILGSLFLGRLLYKLIFFNYIEIYRDRTIINRYIFGDTVIKGEDLAFCRTYYFPFTPTQVFIVKKRKHLFYRVSSVESLTLKQADELSSQIARIMPWDAID